MRSSKEATPNKGCDTAWTPADQPKQHVMRSRVPQHKPKPAASPALSAARLCRRAHGHSGDGLPQNDAFRRTAGV